MPSIMYLEDNESKIDSNEVDHMEESRTAPEPPTRYDPEARPPLHPSGTESSELQSVRRLVTTAEVLALVSLVIGGVVLSTAAVIVAVLALKKANASTLDHPQDERPWTALRRSSKIAFAIAVLALIANAVALAIVYPMFIEALQSGQYSSLLSGNPGQPPTTTGSGSSTWG